MPRDTVPAKLVLEDGRVFPGEAFGAPGEVLAEVVFNTGHTGYQEVLSDPSYTGQAVVFTVPILGIYGVAPGRDDESDGPKAAAIICREASQVASNHRSRSTLGAYLKERRIFGLEGIDTRALVVHLRENGSKNGVLSTEDLDDASLLRKAKTAPDMNGLDLAKVVTTKTAYSWKEPYGDEGPWRPTHARKPAREPGSAGSVIVVDFGVKRGILRHLVDRAFEVEVVPAQTRAEEILERSPDGVLLSNGPGDPAAVTYGIDAARKLLGKVPLYGVCLGHQILALALGAQTRKMKFGHRGSNHPVRDNETGRVLITSHNHGFAVDPTHLSRTPLVATHESLFDGTLEGIRHKELPCAAVQFHPEGSPGPHEAESFFDGFARAIEKHRSRAPLPAASER
ncbi:glutamine-hydrolyzing carbamoyl-phosphate synthase small subunit [bacterium]|nr:glutamine-hydrolyzing carbamoyl-phosphate synthase small subunit [bacterium]